MPMKKGEEHHMAILTEKDVGMILELLQARQHHKDKAKELSFGNIGEKFGVGYMTIYAIEKGTSWAHTGAEK